MECSRFRPAAVLIRHVPVPDPVYAHTLKLLHMVSDQRGRDMATCGRAESCVCLY